MQAEIFPKEAQMSLRSTWRFAALVSKSNATKYKKDKTFNYQSKILKHLRQLVQSDWFLPVFISHDKDTASGLRIDPLKCRVLFLKRDGLYSPI